MSSALADNIKCGSQEQLELPNSHIFAGRQAMLLMFISRDYNYGCKNTAGSYAIVSIYEILLAFYITQNHHST